MDMAMKVDQILVRIEPTHDGLVLIFTDGSELSCARSLSW
jgi:hypothetical protein